jgi:hypothetical protein
MATPTTASTSAQPASSSKPLVATGDWTKNLVHLAKTAELKYDRPPVERDEITIGIFFRRKHALTLQLHTAHILSAQESLEQKNKTIQDLKEQKNKLSIRPPPRFFLEASSRTPGMLIFVARSLYFYHRPQARKREEQTAQGFTRGPYLLHPPLM